MEDNSKYMREHIDKFDNEFKTVSNYIEKYLPIELQKLVNSTLERVLPNSGLEKLDAYKTFKLKELHGIILEDDGLTNLQKKMDA